jgi:pyruvate dehydrogenase E2 component (dihydrolipoamide acetyltransferase)
MPDIDPPVAGDRTSTTTDRIIVALPSLGADMDVGTVIEWRVAVGDRVDRGDIVAIVSTEKSDIDVETWDSGIVTELIAPIDEEIEVGQPLLALGSEAPSATDPLESTDGNEPSVPSAVATTHDPPAPTKDRPPVEPTRTEDPARVRASPLARRLAAEQNVPLASLTGSGPEGAILANDVSATPAPSAPATPDERPEPPISGMRRAIAERMSRSNQDIPHYHLERDIDMTAGLDWLTEHNVDRPIAERVVPAALLACAVARAARDVPSLNGTWNDDRFVAAPGVDLGIVVSLRGGGLVTPTVADADGLDPDQMMAIMREMVTAARKGQLRSRWMAPASITITNLGDNGADRVAGIIFPPQVALVGFGRIADRPAVVDSAVLPRKVVTATLSGDHRATDGAEGSRLLAAVATVLENPERLET